MPPTRQPALIVEEGENQRRILTILQGTQLRHADPVPALIDSMREIAGLQSHLNALSTILTELYNNALDHGILGLDSDLKQDEEGFSRYFQQREQRLQSLSDGEIRIGLRIRQLHRGGSIVIQVEDSGGGFDIERQAGHEPTEGHFSGRGILLVRSLCQRLHYLPPGNKAEAVYVWSRAQGG